MQLRSKRSAAFLITPVDGPDIEVDGGAVFDVPDDLGKNLLEQEDNYELADPPAAKPKKQEA